jgi:unspecific monooxygenase
MYIIRTQKTSGLTTTIAWTSAVEQATSLVYFAAIMPWAAYNDHVLSESPLTSVILIVFLFLLVVARWVYTANKAPWMSVPTAHWSSPYSSIWILLVRYRKKELDTVKAAHQRLGHIVRLGPRDISISCYNNGIRTVFGGGYDKTPYYDFYQYFG